MNVSGMHSERRKRIRVLVSLFFFLLPACTHADRRESIASTERQLLGLLPRVGVHLASLDEDDAVDGSALFLDAGTGTLTPVHHHDEPPPGLTPVLDAWDRAVFVIRDGREWCLVSSGPDRVWTTDSFMVRPVARSDREWHRQTVPFLYASSVATRKGWVLGDDVVVDSRGRVYREYPFPRPTVPEVLERFVECLRTGRADAAGADAYLRDELADFSRKERSAIGGFLRKHRRGLLLAENTWDHECRRKDGLLPRLELYHPEASRHRPGVGVEPTSSGWVLSGSLLNLLEDAAPEMADARRPPPPPVDEIPFFGETLSANGIFFLIGVDAGAKRNGLWERAGENLLALIPGLWPTTELGFVVFDRSSLVFPRSGRPCTAGECAKDFETFLASVDFTRLAAKGRGEEGHWTDCPLEEAQREVLRLANLSARDRKAIVYVHAGSARHCRAGDLNRLVSMVTSMNYQHVVIHCFGAGVPPGSREETLLRRLCLQNGGGYFPVSADSR